MIPLRYWLRDSVRIEPGAAGGACRVMSEVPLTVLEVNSAAARLLERTRYGASIGEIAACARTSEELALSLCEYLRGRGILEVGTADGGSDFTPSVTVIVPTHDRSADLEDCLRSLGRLDYPRDRLEVIVVDDGSTDPSAIAGVVAHHGARLVVNQRNRGPSFSRNRAALMARGEILAFLDSDCVAAPSWLRELVPFFAWERVAAVGGRTTGYYAESRVDRYEEVASPLDMGTRRLLEKAGPGTFYLPTCNLLVRRSAYREVGGLRDDLRVGEDVDLCWRLRSRDGYLVYIPEGIVCHKHRNRPRAMLRRRADYGTSEAALHKLHPDKRKRFPAAPLPVATLAILSAAVIALEPWLLPAGLAPALYDLACRAVHLRRKGVDVSIRRVSSSVLRGHLSVLYFGYFHLVRYHLVALAAIGFLASGVWVLAAFAVLYASAVDYCTRRPRLGYHTYLGCYLAEHVAYQAGVIAGCVRSRTFRSYRLGIRRLV